MSAGVRGPLCKSWRLDACACCAAFRRPGAAWRASWPIYRTAPKKPILPLPALQCAQPFSRAADPCERQLLLLCLLAASVGQVVAFLATEVPPGESCTWPTRRPRAAAPTTNGQVTTGAVHQIAWGSLQAYSTKQVEVSQSRIILQSIRHLFCTQRGSSGEGEKCPVVVRPCT